MDLSAGLRRRILPPRHGAKRLAPANDSGYREDPLDSLPARIVGPWTRRKHHYLGRYADIFSVGMKKWDRRTYVDLFAGPGRCFEKPSDQFYDGSPLIALGQNFTDHVFVELDPTNAQTLRQRCARRSSKLVTVFDGDCNSRVDQVVKAMPANGLALAFIDPTNWQIRFSTIQRLTADRKVDLLVSFFAGMMKRVVQYDQPELDAFFGTGAWRDRRYMGPDGLPTLSGLLAAYREQLLTLGFLDQPSVREIEVKNSRNATMYLLAFFSKNKMGYRFWDEITTEDEKGQLAIKW